MTYNFFRIWDFVVLSLQNGGNSIYRPTHSGWLIQTNSKCPYLKVDFGWLHLSVTWIFETSVTYANFYSELKNMLDVYFKCLKCLWAQWHCNYYLYNALMCRYTVNLSLSSSSSFLLYIKIHSKFSEKESLTYYYAVHTTTLYKL